jgi:hypothetical protein
VCEASGACPSSMIIASINIRGLGGGVKRKFVQELVRKERLDFLAIQETKLETCSDVLCSSLWGGDDCEWAFRPSAGSSGGILSIWRKSFAVLKATFVGEGFVGTCLEWGPQKKFALCSIFPLDVILMVNEGYGSLLFF